jgi:hypothetical protein
MIIDDDHGVAFVHIPKCAGTAVRRQLAPLDSYENSFWGRREHESLGLIDYGHLPLALLETYFPSEFAKIRRYQSFAVVRQPLDRFVSALFERLALFKGVSHAKATARMAIDEADDVMRRLARNEPVWEAPYIHFARQSDFVGLGDQRIVSGLHAIEDLPGLASAIEMATGVALDPGRRENVGLASNIRVWPMIRKAKPLYGKVTNHAQRQAVAKLMNRWKLRTSNGIYGEVRAVPAIRAFVGDYYVADLTLHAEALERAGLTLPPILSDSARSG